MAHSEERLSRLLYVSRNRINAPSCEAFREEIDKILKSAQSRNPALGITGLLTFNQGLFCQVLEGPQEATEELFEIIQMDPRHEDVVVLEVKRIAFRAFKDWAMGYIGDDAYMGQAFGQIDIQTIGMMPDERCRMIFSFMTKLARAHDMNLRAS